MKKLIIILFILLPLTAHAQMSKQGDNVTIEADGTGAITIETDGVGDIILITDQGTDNNTLTMDGTTGDVTISGGTLVQEQKILLPAETGKDGVTNTAWAVTTLSEPGVLLAASQTADVWVIPVTGIAIGDTITAFSVQAQIESGGNTATLDADLRALTNVAAEPTDASVGAITQVSVTADTAVDAEKTGLSDVVAVGEFFYVLITGTTAASTDIQLFTVEVTVTRGNE